LKLVVDGQWDPQVPDFGNKKDNERLMIESYKKYCPSCTNFHAARGGWLENMLTAAREYSVDDNGNAFGKKALAWNYSVKENWELLAKSAETICAEVWNTERWLLPLGSSLGRLAETHFWRGTGAGAAGVASSVTSGLLGAGALTGATGAAAIILGGPVGIGIGIGMGLAGWYAAKKIEGHQ